MHPDAKLLSDEQRKKLCKMMHLALVDLRLLGWAGKTQQVAELADAFHNVPMGMWQNDFSLQFFRDAFIKVYQDKYRDEIGRDYLLMVDEIINTKD